MTGSERSEQLLDIAERLFLDRGYERTTIEAIAASAGVTRPVVYEHFGSKEGVYLACVERARNGLALEIRSAAGNATSAEEAVRASAEAWFAAVERDPERWLVLYEGSLGPMTGDVRAHIDELRERTVRVYVDQFEEWSSEPVPRELVWAAAYAISSMGEGVAKWWTKNPQVPRGDVVAYFVLLAWTGLAPFASTGRRRLADSGSESA